MSPSVFKGIWPCVQFLDWSDKNWQKFFIINKNDVFQQKNWNPKSLKPSYLAGFYDFACQILLIMWRQASAIKFVFAVLLNRKIEKVMSILR